LSDPEGRNVCRSCTAPPAPTSPCLTSPPADYVDRCGQLKNETGPFASCITRFNNLLAGTSTQLYNDCILDACLSTGAAICNNVRSMVDACANIGIQVDCNAWQTSTNCREYHTAVIQYTIVIVTCVIITHSRAKLEVTGSRPSSCVIS